MDKKKLELYAKVVILKALQLKKDEKLYIQAVLEAKEFVLELAKCAYCIGASDVKVKWICNELDLLDFENHDHYNFTTLDKQTAEFYSDYVTIRIESPDLEVFQNIPSYKIQEKAVISRKIRNQAMKERKNGTIIAVPTASWAKVVFPDLPVTEGVEKLWEYVFECVRCNEEDPLKAWDDFVANTRKRRAILNSKKYKTFHYTSSITDLYIDPIDDQFWCGGCNDTDDPDVYCIPNVPTEEVFTCPNKYKVNGYVTSTRPLNFQGKIINDFKLTLKNGKIVDYEAKQGQDVLKSIIETDEGSCYFGEMALIDKNSPISRLNTVFYTTLFDENASCHIAIGLGLAGFGLTPQQKEEQGINVSALHVDFMVGSDDLNIQGMLPDGSWEDVFIKGSWADAFHI